MSSQIVPHASATQPDPSKSLVVHKKHEIGNPTSQLIESLRRDREEHRHKQIWTKDPHGGPYRKVAYLCDFAVVKVLVDQMNLNNLQAKSGNGYDPLTQNPDGSVKELPLGYHHPVETGPTSNFVGNHMTQGAIDLVQAELGQRSLKALLNSQERPNLRLQHIQQPSGRVQPPLLLAVSENTLNESEDAQRPGIEAMLAPVVVVPGRRPPDLSELRRAVRKQRSGSLL